MSSEELARIDAELLRQKKIKLSQLEADFQQKKLLPHLHAQKFYKWGRDVFESTNREIFLCAANQIGKSTVAIQKNIELATNPKLWPKFWPSLNLTFQRPNLFWYFYPNFTLATTEFESKWEQLLPQDRKHPEYGWEPSFDKGLIQKIYFNSGVTIQFKAYSQKLIDIQASSVYHITADEEMPTDFLPEISARTNATDGYFMMVFTATIGQMHWKEAMEPSSKDAEKHPEALKRQISLYDCQEYEDGSPSHWTDQKIKRAIQNCPTEAEIQRRIYGRFVKSTGLEYEGFDVSRNMKEPHALPKEWVIYGGVDPGSGGQSGHPAGMLLLAVNPQCTSGRVIKAWRGDGIPTTSQDILEKYKMMKLNKIVSTQVYDYAAKDFFMIASRQGENFVPADKTKGSGVALLNMLFKSGMLHLEKGDPEIDKLVTELCNLSVGQDKRKAKDDLIDPLRYACMAVPWDFSSLELPENLKEAVILPKKKTSGESRRDWFFDREEVKDSVEAELDEFNELLGTD